jgi:hypothetical protein
MKNGHEDNLVERRPRSVDAVLQYASVGWHDIECGLEKEHLVWYLRVIRKRELFRESREM